MIKKMMYRKIIVASSLLLGILMMYLIPVNNGVNNIKQSLEYVDMSKLSYIYLLDDYGYLGRTEIMVNNYDDTSKILDLIDGLTIDGKKKNSIINGFRGILPKNTKVNDIKIEDGILKIDFSREIYNIDASNEEKMIEALIYTIMEIKSIKKVSIYVDGMRLTRLPNSKKQLDEYLDKSYGINKQYEFTMLNDIDSYTVYYVGKNNDYEYYVPVTKYTNKEGDDIEIIVEEYASNSMTDSCMLNYIDSDVKLLNYSIEDDIINLNFNEHIIEDRTNNTIIEEVRNMIGLSILENNNLKKVVFMVNNEEISTFSLKDID